MVELTAVGSNAAFGLLDWVLLVSIAFIWGTSFLWIKLAVAAFKPGLVAWLRVALGCLVMSVSLLVVFGRRGAVAAVRAVWGPEDRLRVILLGTFWMGGPFMLLGIAAECAQPPPCPPNRPSRSTHPSLAAGTSTRRYPACSSARCL